MADNPRILITISIPILNEAANIDQLVERLRKVAENEKSYNFEFLFTDNASEDDGFEKLTKLAESDPRVRALRFSRNFGFQKSILTNYKNARGQAAIQIDADMQDPPEMISAFLRKWEDGYKVVYGIRRRRQENAFLRSARKCFYWLLDTLTQYTVPQNAGDFRLIDRVILDELRDVSEQTPYLRGMIASFGFPQIGIVYDRDVRQAGRSKFNLFSLLELSFDGITAQSTRPLRLMTLFGFFISLITLCLSLYYFVTYLFFLEKFPSGFTTIVLLLLLLIGLNAFFVGMLGEYIGRIFNNTRGLPLTIIENRLEPLLDTQDRENKAQ